MQLVNEGKHVRLGDKLDSRQQEALRKASVNPNDILANLTDLNSEIQETYSQEANMTVQRPKPVVQQVRPQQAAPQPAPQAISRVERVAQEKAAESADLDGFLDSVQEQLEEEPEADLSMAEQIKRVLAEVKDSPSEQDIARWKQQHGEVYCFALGKTDVYVFTYLKRAQWQRIQETIQEIRSKGDVKAEKLEQQLREKVVQYTTLWPKLPVEFFVNSRAGVVDALYESIMFHSAFLNPQQVVQLTVAL